MLHTTTGRRRAYKGEFEAADLIHWLDQNLQAPSCKRVKDILEDLQGVSEKTEIASSGRFHLHVIDGLVDPWRGLKRSSRRGWSRIPKKKQTDRVKRTVEPVPVEPWPGWGALWNRINARLARYRLFPQFSARSGSGTASGPLIYTRWLSRRVHEWDEVDETLTEGDAIRSMVTLAKEGRIQRVRQCLQCGKWFYARFGHQAYCATKCQQKRYKSDPKWKERRRKYMREYRVLKASGRVKSRSDFRTFPR